MLRVPLIQVLEQALDEAYLHTVSPLLTWKGLSSWHIPLRLQNDRRERVSHSSTITLDSPIRICYRYNVLYTGKRTEHVGWFSARQG